MGREYFCAYHSFLEAMEELGDAERGRLFTACLLYSKTGEEQKLFGDERFLFPGFRSQIDRDSQAYEEKCANNRRNGALKRSPPDAGECCQSPPNAPQDKDKGEDKGKDKGKGEQGENGPRKARFTPPTLAEVASYVAQRHSPVMAQEFIDFYASKGWMVGKTPMKDWKAACRNAERWERWGKREPAGENSAALAKYVLRRAPKEGS